MDPKWKEKRTHQIQMGRASRTGDRVVALDAVIRLLAHITRRAYGQLVAAVRLLAPSGRWYVDTSLSFVHDRRDVPDYLARVLYSSLVVRDLVGDGGVTLAELFTDEKYAGHRDALAMRVTFDGKEVDRVEYDRYTQDRDDVVAVVPRGSGQHFALTGATTYGDVWLRARGYELTKGRVTSDVTYMSMLMGEVHDIYPLPTHETHYALVMRERAGRGYEYTVPVRVGRLHDMRSDGVLGLVASGTTANDPGEHGRTHVIPAPGAFSFQNGKADATKRKSELEHEMMRLIETQETKRAVEQNKSRVEAAKSGMAAETRRRLWMLIDFLLIGEPASSRLRPHAVSLATHITRNLLADETSVALAVSDDSATSILSSIICTTKGETPPCGVEWRVGWILGTVLAGSGYDAASAPTDADKADASLKKGIEEVHSRLLELENKHPKTKFGETPVDRAFALCDGVPYLVGASEGALTALDARGVTDADERGRSHCVYFTGAMYTLSPAGQRTPRSASIDDDDDVSVLAGRGRDRAAVCHVIRVPDAMDLVEKTRMYVNGMDRPLMRLSAGAGVESPLVTYLCAYTVSNLMSWYRRYRDSRYQDTGVLNSIPAALVVVDKDLAAAIDHLQVAKFSCGPRVVRALVADLCRGSIGDDAAYEAAARRDVNDALFGRYKMLVCVALAYQRSEFSMAPYVTVEPSDAATEAAYRSYAARVAYAWELASSVLVMHGLYGVGTSGGPSVVSGGPRWREWLDVGGDTDATRTRQREFRETLIASSNRWAPFLDEAIKRKP